MKAWIERNPLHYPVRVRGGSLSPQRPGQIFRYNDQEGCFGFIYPSDTPDNLIDAWKSYLDELLAALEKDSEAIYVGVDAACPNNEKYQATAGAVLFTNKSLINAFFFFFFCQNLYSSARTQSGPIY